MQETNHIYPIFDKMMTRQDKENLLHQKGVMVWFTGLSGSGKSTIAIALERELHKRVGKDDRDDIDYHYKELGARVRSVDGRVHGVQLSEYDVFHFAYPLSISAASRRSSVRQSGGTSTPYFFEGSPRKYSDRGLWHGIFGADLISVTDGTVVSLGVFTAEFIHVCHSVAGSLAISLSTPVGTVFITGDYKIDFTPLAGEVMSLSRVAEIGRKGVALMLADSTNVERPGYTMSEQVVAETLKRIFGENTENRIIVTTFASNVDRVQIILDLAREFNRKVAVSGRSMENVLE